MESLKNLKSKGLFRQLKILDGIDFASNDYLGLAQNSILRKQVSEFTNNNNLGSTGSALISGYSAFTAETENFLCDHFASEAALVLGSGYLCNLSVMQALGESDTEIFSDESNHASLIDGMRLTKSKIIIFKHNDLNDLESKLMTSVAEKKIIVTESIFSMDGDGPHIGDLQTLAQNFKAILVIDEAHATGVCGGDGKGLITSSENVVVIHTAGKALGSYGAFVTCSKKIKELIVNRGRGFIYSTALPPVLLFQIRASLTYLKEHPELRFTLKQNVRLAKDEFKKLNLELGGSHIGTLKISGNENVLKVQNYLKDKGVSVAAIRYPTVAIGTERLRMSFKSLHLPSQICELAKNVKAALN